jgi:hypothetical protein
MTLYGPAYTFSPDAPADDPRVSQIVSNLGRPADGQFDSSINNLNYCEIFFIGALLSGVKYDSIVSRKRLVPFATSAKYCVIHSLF